MQRNKCMHVIKALRFMLHISFCYCQGMFIEKLFNVQSQKTHFEIGLFIFDINETLKGVHFQLIHH